MLAGCKRNPKSKEPNFKQLRIRIAKSEEAGERARSQACKPTDKS
jgi:hypothetical protein